MATVLKIGARKPKTVVAEKTSGAAASKVSKVKSGAKPGAAVVGRMAGKTSGLTVLKYQNQSLEQNRKRKLTDEQLAKEWCAEFPNSKAVQNGRIDAAMVASVRAGYNRGVHGTGGVPPSTPVPEFDASGAVVPFRGTARELKGAARAAKKGAPAPAPAVKKVKKEKK